MLGHFERLFEKIFFTGFGKKPNILIFYLLKNRNSKD